MSNRIISTILKHDTKVTSYKIALLRAINDVVLSFPDLRTYHQDVAVPLRLLAEYWVAYYWAFADPVRPILQGQRATRDGSLRKDMAFRSALTEFRDHWEQLTGGISRSADGFLAINEMRVPRKRSTYAPELIAAYERAITAIVKSLEMPIQYAGPGNWTVFEKPVLYKHLSDRAVPVPGTASNHKCLIITADLWQTFREMSLWVEALCIHEWCLFTERISQQAIGRGEVYALLTERPDNRRPLSWESNNIDLLLLEGNEFICPWTAKRITAGVAYDLDHLLPLSVYPINELWNLVPSDPDFNRNKKRDRLPTLEKLQQARPYLEWDYDRYGESALLSQALKEDVRLRFSTLKIVRQTSFAQSVSEVVVDLIEQIAETRNLRRFG